MQYWRRALDVLLCVSITWLAESRTWRCARYVRTRSACRRTWQRHGPGGSGSPIRQTRCGPSCKGGRPWQAVTAVVAGNMGNVNPAEAMSRCSRFMCCPDLVKWTRVREDCQGVDAVWSRKVRVQLVAYALAAR